MCVLNLLFPKTKDQHLGFADFEGRLFSVHHAARLLISLRYEVSSLFVIQPMMVVSSTNFTAEFSPCRGLQFNKSNIQLQSVVLKPTVLSLLVSLGRLCWMLSWNQETAFGCRCCYFQGEWRLSGEQWTSVDLLVPNANCWGSRLAGPEELL